jgi:hypothetical protein
MVIILQGRKNSDENEIFVTFHFLGKSNKKLFPNFCFSRG